MCGVGGGGVHHGVTDFMQKNVFPHSGSVHNELAFQPPISNHPGEKTTHNVRKILAKTFAHWSLLACFKIIILSFIHIESSRIYRSVRFLT